VVKAAQIWYAAFRMKLYNSLTQDQTLFTPVGDDVTLYVCGITPYDTTHLGHAFTYVTNDNLVRYLEYTGYTVTYVQNVTDIDDDILRKAAEIGEDWWALGNRWTRHFIDDLITLNVRPPDFFPRASDVVSEMHTLIQSLLAAGYAYESAGNVYFQVDKWPPFGKLSKLPATEMLPVANERGNFPDDPHKRDPLDFVLWQEQKGGEPAWESPWGKGRPGWHIECSTLASHYLGDSIDIHSGGADLIFPHHECEIAQMEPVTGREPFVRYWLHTAMVRYQGEKMSKSLGNLIMVRDLLQSWSANAIRLYLAQHHYRQPWSHSEQELQTAQKTTQLWERAAGIQGPAGNGGMDPTGYAAAFQAAMNNDLDTPEAVMALQELAQVILAEAAAGKAVARAQNTLRQLANVLGLHLDNGTSPPENVTAGWLAHRRRFEDSDGE
jgi:L-cysteine:1D-myo-inositol 2-amino-2-deoxy-alpha-D-glucopyranoside ligase